MASFRDLIEQGFTTDEAADVLAAEQAGRAGVGIEELRRAQRDERDMRPSGLQRMPDSYADDVVQKRKARANILNIPRGPASADLDMDDLRSSLRLW